MNESAECRYGIHKLCSGMTEDNEKCNCETCNHE